MVSYASVGNACIPVILEQNHIAIAIISLILHVYPIENGQQTTKNRLLALNVLVLHLFGCCALLKNVAIAVLEF